MVVKKVYRKGPNLSIWSTKKIVIDNAQNFNNKMAVELCVKWKIKYYISSPYKQKNEHCRSCQHECQEDYLEDYGHLKRLA